MELDGQTKVRKEGEETHSAAAGRILQFIRDRRYEPLERLPSERELAEKFKMGRGAIREALSALEALRVVERRPNSGIYLRNLDERSFEPSFCMPRRGFRSTATKSWTRSRSGACLRSRRLSWLASVGQRPTWKKYATFSGE